MIKIWTIAANTFQEILRKKVFYFGLFLLALVIFISVKAQTSMQIAAESGDVEAASDLRGQSVGTILNIWSFFSMFLCIYFGATVLPSEIKTRTIVSALVRPVEVWQFLMGKWMGVVLFIFAFLAVGISVALGFGWHWGVHFPRLFWLGLAEIFVRALFFSGVGLGLSAVMSPAVAGGAAFFLTILPGMVKGFLHHPDFIPSSLAACVYYFCPADMPVDLLHGSLTRDILNPNYPLYIQVLLENAFYAVFAFMGGSFLFSRRDIPLK